MISSICRFQALKQTLPIPPRDMKAILILLSLFRISLAISLKRGTSLSKTPKRDQCIPPPHHWVVCSTTCHTDCMCQTSLGVTTNSPSYFDDWDFKLSKVVQGPTTVKIDSSIKIPTTWNVVPSYPVCYTTGIYEGGIGEYLRVDPNRLWNVYNDGTTYTVPAGQYGVIVINPWTSRTGGMAQVEVSPDCPYATACPGSGTAVAVPFALDTRQQDSALGPGIFVGGTITFITSPTLPIPCHIGKCSHS